MIKSGIDAFPVAHRDSASAALSAAFGSAPLGAVTAMTGGATTASVYRVEVGERHYLLRIEGEPSPLRNPHQYVSMRIATEAVQLYGGYGYCKDYRVERLMRDAKITQIWEGTNQIHRQFIGKSFITK